VSVGGELREVRGMAVGSGRDTNRDDTDVGSRLRGSFLQERKQVMDKNEMPNMAGDGETINPVKSTVARVE
jgi:hypothetical protein